MSTAAQRLPDLGGNPLQDALENYQTMEHQLGLHREELATKSDMVNDLLRENEFLRRNYDKAVAERDRYQALAVNLATRAVGVREAVERLLAEAVNAKAPPLVVAEEPIADLEAPVGQLLAEHTVVVTAPEAIGWLPEPGVIKREITERTITGRTTLAPNEFR